MWINSEDMKQAPSSGQIIMTVFVLLISILLSILLSVLLVYMWLVAKDALSNFLWETLARDGWSDTPRTGGERTKAGWKEDRMCVQVSLYSECGGHSSFHEEVDFRLGLTLGKVKDLVYNVFVFVHPSYHRLSANWSREDILQLEDDCQSSMIGQPELQAASKAQRLREGWCCWAEERAKRHTHTYSEGVKGVLRQREARKDTTMGHT